MLITVLPVIPLAAALLYRFGRPYLVKRRTKDSADWSETEATIQSGEIELAERVGHIGQRLPFFAFSYVVDNEYYSGRFGLRVAEDQAKALVREWINTKITIQYDPQHPSIFSVPDELPVDGFRVSTVPETELVSQH